MGEEWSVLGTVIAGFVALVIALGRGYLLTPHHVDQWRSRYEDMRDDRNYWRMEARKEQREHEDTIDLSEQKLDRNDV